MTNILEIHDLYVQVEEDMILKGVNLQIPEGEVHALFGPNGGGKTSLMMTIMGFSKYKVLSGEILFKGQDITRTNITERALLGIGVAQQRPPTIAGVKLSQLLQHTLQMHPEKDSEIQRLIETARVGQFLDREINAGLSGGEIRRSELLQLISTAPDFAMLDEIDSGVDVEALDLVGNLSKQLFALKPTQQVKRRSGLIITHNGAMLEHVFTDKAHVIIDGKMACSGNSRLILETAGASGYENCAACIRGEFSGIGIHGVSA